MDWAIQSATEALIGMQNDCNSMMKLTKEERDSLLFSVAASLREVKENGRVHGVNEGLDAAEQIVQLARSGDIDGDFRCVASHIRNLKIAPAAQQTSGKTE